MGKVITLYEKLKSLPNSVKYSKLGIAFEILDAKEMNLNHSQETELRQKKMIKIIQSNIYTG